MDQNGKTGESRNSQESERGGRKKTCAGRLGSLPAIDVWSNERIDWKGIINGSRQHKTSWRTLSPLFLGRENFGRKLGKEAGREREMKRDVRSTFSRCNWPSTSTEQGRCYPCPFSSKCVAVWVVRSENGTATVLLVSQRRLSRLASRRFHFLF